MDGEDIIGDLESPEQPLHQEAQALLAVDQEARIVQLGHNVLPLQVGVLGRERACVQ